MIFAQIFDMVNIGLVILDQDLNVYKWNRWMEIHSRIPAGRIVGSPLFEFFPNLDNPSFLRNFKSVLTFGNFSFFSQKLHRYLFPFKAASPVGAGFEYMQQSCTMAPLWDDDNQLKYVFITVQDVTDVAAYQRKLIEMNIKDGLTGIYNRRHLEKTLANEYDRHTRYYRPFSIIIQDIDHFKRINDTYGHQAGDQVLKQFAALIESKVRRVDTFARYGGEEFCCLLPETRLADAVTLAQLLQERVEHQKFEYKDKEIPITISQGVAELTEEMESLEELLTAADKALYRAKQTGRNRVVPMDEVMAEG